MQNFRDKFILPENKIYFLGNSLGLQPKKAPVYINEVLSRWSVYGVEGFFLGDDPWLNYNDHIREPMAAIVGAKPAEVVAMNSLTVNLHLLLASFYRPTRERFKIICEANAFPSDQYMLETHVKQRGLDPKDVLIEVAPRNGEYVIREEDIAATISKHAAQLSLVFWGGVNYYTGQVFNIQEITRLAHDAGALAGFDLAHAAGNIDLQLHEWNVDFAAWCTYKYLNSGPGGIGAAYVHERYHEDAQIPRLAGWWGYDKDTRFEMKKGFRPIASAEGWQVSTAPIMLLATLRASLELFVEAGMNNLAIEGKRLSDCLMSEINLINQRGGDDLIKVLTPADAKGCQLSLMVKRLPRQVFEQLQEHGIFADWREPDVIRVAPVPLYNNMDDIAAFAAVMKKIIA